VNEEGPPPTRRHPGSPALPFYLLTFLAAAPSGPNFLRTLWLCMLCLPSQTSFPHPPSLFCRFLPSLLTLLSSVESSQKSPFLDLIVCLPFSPFPDSIVEVFGASVAFPLFASLSLRHLQGCSCRAPAAIILYLPNCFCSAAYAVFLPRFSKYAASCPAVFPYRSFNWPGSPFSPSVLVCRTF